ncbi:unnamed protein product [Coregonus sp. 'balchen']|nr:unnamed protein product [Coregonus sp. 'balchen']
MKRRAREEREEEYKKSTANRRGRSIGRKENTEQEYEEEKRRERKRTKEKRRERRKEKRIEGAFETERRGEERRGEEGEERGRGEERRRAKEATKRREEKTKVLKRREQTEKRIDREEEENLTYPSSPLPLTPLIHHYTFPMLNMSTPSELKSPCVTRNGMVKLPPQPNGLGSASITKGTPAAKNRLCQSSSVPGILPPPSLPYHLDPLPTAASLLGPNLDTSPLTALQPPLRKVPLTLPKPPLPLALTLPLALLLPLERQLALDEKLLNRLLWYFTTAEKCVLAQVCRTWRKVLYQPKFWEGVTPVLHAKELYALLPSGEKEFVSLQAFALRGFQAFCLVGVSDLDICEFIDNYSLSKKGVKSVSLKRSTITDAGLESSQQSTLLVCGGVVSIDYCGGAVSIDYCGGVVSIDYCGGVVSMDYCGGVVSIDYCGGAVSIDYCGGVVSMDYCGGVVSMDYCGGVVSIDYCGGVVSIDYCGGVVSID